ncbi:hypothetical protein [Variovorax sp. ZT4R33]|uniref:hypothetical protein n=1 Tax=Variovorax sp. ZT4R33 TaxID=3443743 RepID=UPI003F4582B5
MDAIAFLKMQRVTVYFHLTCLQKTHGNCFGNSGLRQSSKTRQHADKAPVGNQRD